MRVRALSPAGKAVAGGLLALVAVGIVAVAAARRGGLAGPPAGAVGAGPEAAAARASDAPAGEPEAADPERAARLERDLAARAESLLSRIAGAGRVEVRVHAELDRSRREETLERFDPEGQVERSEERTTAAAGAATERVEYDVGRKVMRTVTPPGAIERLHVAVLVDRKPGGDGAGSAPWSPDELSQIETLAKQAVGFSAERGDTLTVASVPFETPAPGPLAVLGGDAATALALVAALLALAFFALRTARRAPAIAGLPMPVSELEALLLRAGAADETPSAADAHAGGEAALRIDLAGDAGAAAVRAWLEE